jgi:hypothetical protein
MYVKDDFHTTKRLHVRLCDLHFWFFPYAVNVDAADAGVDGAGALAVGHVDSMTGVGVGIFGPPNIVPPAKG